MVDLVTQDRIARTQALSNALAQGGLGGGRVSHPMQGFGNLAKLAASSILSQRADRQQKQRQDASQAALLGLLGGGGTPGAATPGAGTPIVPGAGVDPGFTTPGPATAPSASRTPSLEQLLSTVGKFPELRGALNPLIAARMQPQGPTKGVVVGAGGRLVNPVTGDLIAEGGPRALTLREVADPTSPTGTRLVPIDEASGKAGPPRQEFRMETVTGPDGETRTIWVRGRPGGGSEESSGLTKPTTSKLEQSITQGVERLGRIRSIRETFDPAFLNLPNQLFTKGAAMAERLGVELGPETKKQVADFTRFRTNTLRNMNKTLNELSGAAISPAEAERLKAELPTEDDSPTQFAAKLENIEKQIEAAIARNQALLAGGISDLKFGDNGEILNAPSLEEFMLRQEVDARDVSRETIPNQAGLGAGPVGDFSQMSEQDILDMDLRTLTPEQQKMIGKRMDQLGL